MLKRISWIGLIALFGFGIAMLSHSESVRAGTYKLEYPQGYGCSCPVNVMGYGYYKTGWREWPGELRLDKTFPRSVGMEAISAPKGQKIIPLPKVRAGEIQPGGEEGAMPQGGLPFPEMPGITPTEPGQTMPALPGLPEEPGGFNPLPSLPPDLGVPMQDNPSEKQENSTDTENKKENDLKDILPEGDKSEMPAPNPKPEDKGARIRWPKDLYEANQLEPIKQSHQKRGPKVDRAEIIQTGVDEEVRSEVSACKDAKTGNAAKSSSNSARGAVYYMPTESAMTARFSRDVEQQSYQEPDDSQEVTVEVQSESPRETPVIESQQNVPAVALDGYCPVELSDQGRWVQGNPRWTVVYKGSIYRFSGNAQRQAFMAQPMKYIPGNGGYDPVVSAVEKRNVQGQVNYCAAYKGRIYMFSSPATQVEFHKNPDFYVRGLTK